MSRTIICIAANTLYYPQGGGHLWVHLNWALGFKANGCEVYWLEMVDVSDDATAKRVRTCLSALKKHLSKYELQNNIILFNKSDHKLPDDIINETISLKTALDSDLLFNLRYDLSANFIKQFKKTALLDIDPGLLQFFLSNGTIKLATHDLYFTIGETVGQPGSRFPSAGIDWLYTPPCVATDWWTPKHTLESAPFTTLSHWNTDQWVVEEDGYYYSNDKRDGFLPFFDIPQQTSQLLELALCLEGDTTEKEFLTNKGWRIKEAKSVSDSPVAYQQYIENSKGEFSCVKPHCIRFENAWISDRTLCYLASGKPAIVQYTGSSKFLPDNAGLFRFKDFEGAIACLNDVSDAYEKHSSLARSLAEEFFDAKMVTAKLLEKVL